MQQYNCLAKIINIKEFKDKIAIILDQTIFYPQGGGQPYDNGQILNSRLHSAGHLIDMSIQRLDLNLKPLKGYNFPDGPYVEYIGNEYEFDFEKLKINIENMANKIISKNIKTKIVFDNTKTVNGKIHRKVLYDEYEIDCGGTHVKDLLEIGKIHIRNIKKKDGNIRIGYEINN